MKPAELKPSPSVNKRVGTVVAIALPIVAGFEGLWLVAKPDRLANGIPTVCYGETENVRLGDKYSPQDCADMLALKLPRYQRELDALIKPDILVKMPDKTHAAFLSFVYNIGTGKKGFAGSTARRRLNAGDLRGACNAMLSWTKSGGKFRQGLLNRRRKERALCLEGIDKK